MFRLFFIFLLIPFLLSAQKKTAVSPYAVTDRIIDGKSFSTIGELARFIDGNFGDDLQKTRAIFYWITSNIDYSTDLMYTYQYKMEPPALAAEAFNTHKAVCAGYAALFDTLALLTGVHSELVQGSTKQDFLPSVSGHCWNVVKLGDKWGLVDPTWGSGHLTNQKYVRKRNEQYFLGKPGQMIKTHLPFDPIWQLLEKPLTLYEFNTRSSSSVKQPWNYSDSITEYLGSQPMLELRHSQRRLKQFGNNSEPTNNYYLYLENRQIDYFNKISNKSTAKYNEAVEVFNEYINYKNKQFQPVKADPEIASLLTPASEKLLEAEKGYDLILSNLNDPDFNAQVTASKKLLHELQGRITEEQAFVDKYLGTKKNKRRNLFYTRTYSVFGIPVN